MNRQEEYELRKKIGSRLLAKVDQYLDEYYEKYRYKAENMILYPLIYMEKRAKELSFIPDTLVLINPIRTSFFWFIKEMRKRQNGIEEDFSYNVEDYNYFVDNTTQNIIYLYDRYKRGNQVQIMRSSAKVNIIEIGGRYQLDFPIIDDKYEKNSIYYYGLDDSSRRDDELTIIIKSEKYLIRKFDMEKMLFNPSLFKLHIKQLGCMLKDNDKDFFNLCRARVEIDINKIAKSISSDIIENIDEIKDIYTFFYYISKVKMYRYSYKGLFLDDEWNDYYCKMRYNDIIPLAYKFIGIERKRFECYLDFFAMNISVEGGAFNEFPLIIYNQFVYWMPNAFILNDLQFTIVNAHYYKKIIFYERDKTVAQSVVDYIAEASDKFNNIITSKNYEYFEQNIKFKGKDLKSDIDIALYDVENNCLLIIECKWKENVYPDKENYVTIEKAMSKIFNEQLEKHEFYLGLNAKNLNKLFDNQIEFELKIKTLKIGYIFVDKRIQFHDYIYNRHAVPIFVLSYLFQKYKNDLHLPLTELLNELESLKMDINYESIEEEKLLNF